MLTYTCDFCGSTFDADIDGSRIVYMNQNKREAILRGDAPCSNCEQVAKNAAIDALNKRKENTANL